MLNKVFSEREDDTYGIFGLFSDEEEAVLLASMDIGTGILTVLRTDYILDKMFLDVVTETSKIRLEVKADDYLDEIIHNVMGAIDSRSYNWDFYLLLKKIPQNDLEAFLEQ